MIKIRFDYLFWLIFILFSNPGGIQQVLGIYEIGSSGYNLNDILIVIMGGLYLLTPKGSGFLDRNYLKIRKYLLVFIIYYLFIFGYFTPLFRDTQANSIIYNFIKLRWATYSILLFFFTFRFFSRNHYIYFRLLAISSIIILLIFFISTLTGINILPVNIATREFIDINRNLLVSYGFMPVLVPVGAVLVIFKLNIKYRKILLVGAGMMFIAWLISLTRRHIFGTVIYIILAVLLYNYFRRKQIISFLPVIRFLFASIIVLGFIYFSFPKYINAGIETVEETIHVLKYGESTAGKKDKRLGFGNEFIVDIFIKNPILGSGFDNRWRTSEGDKQGYEASDYHFLAALAMTGLAGIFFFLPVYIILIKNLLKDILFFRRNGFNKSFEFFLIILFIIYFIYHILQYFNWFSFISNPNQYNFIVYLAMYLVARNKFYYSLYKK